MKKTQGQAVLYLSRLVLLSGENDVNMSGVSSGHDPGFLLVNRKLVVAQINKSKSCP